MNFGHWILPFDVAQGGEPVEPFVICYLVLRIYLTHTLNWVEISYRLLYLFEDFHVNRYELNASTSEFMASKFSLGVTGEVVPDVEKM